MVAGAVVATIAYVLFSILALKCLNFYYCRVDLATILVTVLAIEEAVLAVALAEVLEVAVVVEVVVVVVDEAVEALVTTAYASPIFY